MDIMKELNREVGANEFLLVIFMFENHFSLLKGQLNLLLQNCIGQKIFLWHSHFSF